MSLEDVTDIIADVSETVTVTRYAAPTIVAGRSVAGATSTVAIVACVQPLSSRELQFLPEGMVARGVRKVFTTTQLLCLPMPDRFAYGGEVWEIVEERDWGYQGNYHRYFAARVTLP